MIIVRSIPDTVKFYMEMNKQLQEKGLQNKIKCLIGFSGETDYNGDKVTEISLIKIMELKLITFLMNLKIHYIES